MDCCIASMEYLITREQEPLTVPTIAAVVPAELGSEVQQ
jgi:hypothetical protein